MMINANKYRTVAILYPYASFEVEFEVNGNLVYSNMDVEGMSGETFSTDTTSLEDLEFWTYIKPLDELTLDIEEDYASLSDEETLEIARIMVDLWNANPVWDKTGAWHTV